MGIPSELTEKRAVLEAELRSLGRLLVAYSGGTDSAFLAWAAHRALGADMLAVIADSASLARYQLADAEEDPRPEVDHGPQASQLNPKLNPIHACMPSVAGVDGR